jgi:hypothetical protein
MLFFHLSAARELKFLHSVRGKLPLFHQPLLFFLPIDTDGLECTGSRIVAHGICAVPT